MRPPFTPLRRVALAVLVVAAVAGCASEDRAAVAAAKCVVPVQDALTGPGATVPEDGPLQRTGVQVTDLGRGRYLVTGIVLTGPDHGPGSRPDRGASFVCEVAPDSADTLRGFKVTHLEVGQPGHLG